MLILCWVPTNCVANSVFNNHALNVDVSLGSRCGSLFPYILPSLWSPSPIFMTSTQSRALTTHTSITLLTLTLLILRLEFQLLASRPQDFLQIS